MHLTSDDFLFHNSPCVDPFSSLSYTYHFYLTTIVYLFENRFQDKIAATTEEVKLVYICYVGS